MKAIRTLIVVAAALVVIAAVALTIPLVTGGFSARDEPWWLEGVIARRLRVLAIPRDARDATNPVPASDELLRRARAHFGDHCAACHGADGAGDTTIGKNLFPKAPDMRKADTQSLSDGELFFIIHNGIRYTGMPAWGSGAPERDHDSWELVHLIRRMPQLSTAEVDEIERAMPKTADSGEHAHSDGADEHDHRGRDDERERGDVHEHGAAEPPRPAGNTRRHEHGHAGHQH